MKEKSVYGTLLKTIVYRILAFAISFSIAYFVTNDYQSAGVAAIGIEIAKFILYYIFEVSWDYISPHIFEDALFTWECDNCGMRNKRKNSPDIDDKITCKECKKKSSLIVQQN